MFDPKKKSKIAQKSLKSGISYWQIGTIGVFIEWAGALSKHDTPPHALVYTSIFAVFSPTLF